MNKLLVIIGPSASGKTKLALNIAKKLNCSVLSADSRQIYKNLDYSTGKISIESNLKKHSKNINKWIINNVNYWGYDVLEPNAEFSAGDFVNFTNKVINEDKNFIVCGGTGLYVTAITNKTSLTTTPKNPKLREQLKKHDCNKLLALLKKEGFNIDSLNNSEKNNIQRLIRRIEIAKNKQLEQRYNLIDFTDKKEYLFVGIELNEYKQKIENWVELNFNEIKKEVKWLLNTYPNSPLFNGFIFSEFKMYIQKNITDTKCKNLVTLKYLQYIKRQKTYFKKNFNEAVWFSDLKKAEHYILDKI